MNMYGAEPIQTSATISGDFIIYAHIYIYIYMLYIHTCEWVCIYRYINTHIYESSNMNLGDRPLQTSAAISGDFMRSKVPCSY